VILLASDHAGFELKRHLMDSLERGGRVCTDLGAFSTASVDYPDLAHELSSRVGAGDQTIGILICGTGLGMSMAANRHPGVRAALCHDAYTAEMARRHNDANVLCLGARVLGPGLVEQIIDVFLTTPYEQGRHARRVSKIDLPGECHE